MLCDDGEMENDDKESIPPLKGASDVKFVVDGEALVARCALNMQVEKEDNEV